MRSAASAWSAHRPENGTPQLLSFAGRMLSAASGSGLGVTPVPNSRFAFASCRYARPAGCCMVPGCPAQPGQREVALENPPLWLLPCRAQPTAQSACVPNSPRRQPSACMLQPSCARGTMLSKVSQTNESLAVVLHGSPGATASTHSQVELHAAATKTLAPGSRLGVQVSGGTACGDVAVAASSATAASAAGAAPATPATIFGAKIRRRALVGRPDAPAACRRRLSCN